MGECVIFLTGTNIPICYTAQCYCRSEAKEKNMTLTQLSTNPEILLIEADFPSMTPDVVFNYWTEPFLLQRWWPQNAELDPRVGGSYHFSWPQMNWHLRGSYTSFEPGRQLGFTWRWDHDVQDARDRHVEIRFEPLATGGTRLHLTHGRYLDTPEDQEIRNEHHLTGWQHFLSRLQQELNVSK
jgi:uncharacterized protein YndB with AHSA1/START domain